jgi:hypothetical protein
MKTRMETLERNTELLKVKQTGFSAFCTQALAELQTLSKRIDILQSHVGDSEFVQQSLHDMRLCMSNLQDSFEGFKEQLEGPMMTVTPGVECLMDELSRAIKVLPFLTLFVILRFSFQKEALHDCAVFVPVWKVCWKNLCLVLGAIQPKVIFKGGELRDYLRPRYVLNLVER